ncbi:hypothetical protein HBI56_171390 [Parastagonospora nodorum]|uniref:Uncharacterized protein n=1 Tax=Phaeosphaeria nodorum (strain SN15 / ATCC MYA-4574 / FGSC 10173) TaxID=321614 RepID=A0A7U2F3Q9_PHANO|nr:hypothetical protein HBH56_234210 [Parastagonospora nodorum]QRC97068.1 hypothetical protein JI435_140390 [Parastagonospora nodorum SN15]KAH3921357.1 hypothetical protein HBH54_242270 [Parastagonospora nodorum]KAH3944531.1 hypothetical protein HBH53_157990 [Parastagonospora nodorum]KAH4012667.1 hypothetical protein HBI09_221720 [Parastagonospora nodorum]
MPSQSIPSSPKRLLFGTATRSSPNKSQTNDKNTRKPDRIVYYSVNEDKKYEPINFKGFDLLEPFSHINLGHARGPGGLLYMVLHYFLEKGCTQYLTFTKIGFENFEKACADVADAITLLGARPSKPILLLRPASQSSGSPKDDDNEVDMKIFVATTTGTAATATGSCVLSATKRARNVEEDIPDDHRPAKKTDETERASFIDKLREIVASDGNLKASNENLRRQCASWEATAKSTDEKRKKTEQQRHAAEEQRREA